MGTTRTCRRRVERGERVAALALLVDVGSVSAWPLTIDAGRLGSVSMSPAGPITRLISVVGSGTCQVSGRWNTMMSPVRVVEAVGQLVDEHVVVVAPRAAVQRGLHRRRRDVVRRDDVVRSSTSGDAATPTMMTQPGGGPQAPAAADPALRLRSGSWLRGSSSPGMRLGRSDEAAMAGPAVLPAGRAGRRIRRTGGWSRAGSGASSGRRRVRARGRLIPRSAGRGTRPRAVVEAVRPRSLARRGAPAPARTVRGRRIAGSGRRSCAGQERAASASSIVVAPAGGAAPSGARGGRSPVRPRPRRAAPRRRPPCPPHASRGNGSRSELMVPVASTR